MAGEIGAQAASAFPRRAVRPLAARALAVALARSGAPPRAVAAEATRLERAIATLTSPSASAFAAAVLAAVAAVPATASTAAAPDGEEAAVLAALGVLDASVAAALTAAVKLAAAPRVRRAAAPRAPPPPPNPRGTLRAAFVDMLTRGEPTAAPAAVAAAATALETACYNAAVTACVNAEDPPRRQWDSAPFVDIYGARCGVVLGSLDPAGCCASFPSCAGLARRLTATPPGGERLTPAALALAAALGALTAAEICPEAFAVERAEIERRLAQHIEVNECTMFTCPHCRVRRCTYVERQRRAADEGRDYDCTCLACGLPFRGHD